MGLVTWKVTILIHHNKFLNANADPFARYRSTATLISLILEAGYQCPHRTIDQYVEAFTGFVPTDGKDWTDREPELPSHFDLDSRVSKLHFEKMSESSRYLSFVKFKPS